MKKMLLVVLCSLLMSCGFQLRGIALLPFKTIYVTSPIVDFGNKVKRVINSGSNTLVVDKPQDAEAILQITSATYTKHIWSISGSGRVNEFQLRYRVSYRLTDPKGRELVPASVITLSRIMPYGDAQILAKEAEEKMLVREIQDDAALQIIRRLSKVQR